ncbi:MAG: sporulation integral membrane protein YtvI [Clostridia bacterium]|nr:sporulation integral membrane protein YtvI [Clostridia bacterium]
MNSAEKRLVFIINSVYFFIIGTITFLFIKYLLGILLPFILAFLISAMSRKIILRIEESCKSIHFASVFFTVLLILILSLSIYGVAFGITKELMELSKNVTSSSVTEFFNKLTQKTAEIFSSFPQSDILERIAKDILKGVGNLDSALSSVATSALPSVISFLMRFISFFPSAVIFLCFMFISMFYISIDYDKICSFFKRQLPEKVLDTFDETKNVILSTAKELFKSYFLLTFITFLQLFTGFLIIGIDYALMLSAIISIIDLLPILGTGTVLIPWSAVCFIINDYRTGAGLIVLYAVITVFRQVVQPKIIGAGAGLSPLLSLISIFAGLKLLGFTGILIFPIIMATVIELNKKGFIRLYRNYPEKNDETIKQTRLKFLRFKRHDSQHFKQSGSDTNDRNSKDD